MRQRRTLSQALQTSEFSEDAIAFVSGSVPQLAGKTAASERLERAHDSAPEAAFPEALSSGTVSMTFRLPSELCSRLLRVSLDRKLKRQRPFTQQDIMAEALNHWLKKRDDSL